MPTVNAQTNPETAEISNLTYSNGNGGLTVTFTLNVYNLINQLVHVGIWFQDDYGNGILHSGNDNLYRDPNGHLTYQTDITPLYEGSVFENFSMFIPYEQFPGDIKTVFPLINVFSMDRLSESIKV